MAGQRRKKHRTHVVATKDIEIEKAPKSFVIRSGILTRAASQLALDLRRVMEPNTASNLKERKTNKLKDYMAVAAQLNVSHFMLISQSETGTNLRISKFPKGPTLYFKISEYMLAKDVMACQKNPKSPGLEFATAPLLVLNNFDVESSEGKLLCSMFQGMLPTINTAKVKLVDIRRVLLLHYDRDGKNIEVRHYSINVKMTGVSKLVNRIVRSDIPDLGAVADIGDFLLKAAADSESEVEPDSMVTLGQDYHGQSNTKSSQRSIALTEMGPRLQLKLVKILDGFCEGEILYHANPVRKESKVVFKKEKKTGFKKQTK